MVLKIEGRYGHSDYLFYSALYNLPSRMSRYMCACMCACIGLCIDDFIVCPIIPLMRMWPRLAYMAVFCGWLLQDDVTGLYSFDAYEGETGANIWCRSDTRDEAEVIVLTCLFYSISFILQVSRLA